MKPTLRNVLVVVAVAGCATPRYQDKTMDFAAVKTVAVMPFNNLSRDSSAGERVRDVFSNLLLASGAAYVLPTGEVARGINKVNPVIAVAPSIEEVVNLGKVLQVNAIITGTLKEYGEVRSGSSTANVVSLSLQMYETQTGKVVWAAESTKGGISWTDRLFGGGGTPMNNVTEDAVRDLLHQMFK